MNYSTNKHVPEVEGQDGQQPASRSTSNNGIPDSEVSGKAKRRSFSAKEKLRILEEADRCSKHGQVGALLRREGIYSSHLANWRNERRDIALTGLAPRQRGRKATEPAVKAAVESNKMLQRENERLKKKLAYAELIIDVQKKVSEMLGIPLKSLDDGDSE